ncbi:MAG: hypothetical protein NC824_03280 [Candidatus Omnitrophica bacterium]|nr:hypothetical protein [Candidatus Omnitrophota bacterium]
MDKDKGKENKRAQGKNKFMDKKTPFWEDLIIILSIFTLWPTILRRETSFSKILMSISFILLVWILIIRMKRMREVSK